MDYVVHFLPAVYGRPSHRTKQRFFGNLKLRRCWPILDNDRKRWPAESGEGICTPD